MSEPDYVVIRAAADPRVSGQESGLVIGIDRVNLPPLPGSGFRRIQWTEVERLRREYRS